MDLNLFRHGTPIRHSGERTLAGLLLVETKRRFESIVEFDLNMMGNTMGKLQQNLVFNEFVFKRFPQITIRTF